MTDREALKHFEEQLRSAQVVLDGGFGTRSGEDNFLYRRRKDMAACAISALRERIDNGWISVADRTPKSGIINCHTLDLQQYMCIYTSPVDGARDVRPIAYKDGKWLQHGSDVTERITHWLENPSMPEQKG